ncbi:hypothetical protein JCM8097_001211 [Rhodosporidiobolus ruineniae]
MLALSPLPAGRAVLRHTSTCCYSAARSRPPTRPRPAPAASPPPPRLDVRYEDDRCLVLNKPAGVALQGQHGSTARRAWDALLSAIRARPDCANAVPVHRLDKSTSGVLLLAKQPQHAARLSKQLQRHEIHRTYLAVVHGQLKQGYAGEIDAPLRVEDDRVRLAQDGIEAKTAWACLAASPSFSLLSLKPATGRKHQLRVHCADYLQAPIVGDFKIAPSAPHAAALSAHAIPHDTLLLHATNLSFHAWEKSGRRTTITASAPPPSAFIRFCKAHKLALPPQQGK